MLFALTKVNKISGNPQNYSAGYKGQKKTLSIKTLNNRYLRNNNRSILAKCSKGSCWQLQSEYKTNKIIALKST